MEDEKELGEELRIDENLKSRLEDQDLGTHICCIYRNKEEQLSALSSFMSLGIERNEKCLYVIDDRTKEEVVEAFESLGFDVEDFVESGQFEFMTKSESYLKDGYFDPDEMINLLEEAKEEALEEGYDGLRVTGEMTWFFSDMPGVERLMEYETKLNKFLPGQKVIALCQYNEGKFTHETLVDVLHTHPKVLIYNDLHENSLYMPPEVFKAQQEGKVTQEHYEGMKENIIERTRLRREEEKAEKKLRESKRQLDAIFNDPETFIGIIDTDGTLLEANKSALDFIGVNSFEVKGKKFWNGPWWTHSQKLQERLKESIEKAKNGEIVRFEATHLGEGGEEITVDFSLRPIRNEDDEIVSLIASGKDITERKKAEKELEERHRQLKTLLSNLPGMAYRCSNNRKWTMKFVSDGCEDLTGYKSKELIDDNELSFRELIISEDREPLWEEVQTALEKEEPYELTYRIETKDGQEKWVWAQGQGIFDEGGEVKFLEGIIQDITDRKENEEELRELNQFRERIIQDANIWINVLDNDANVLVWNKAAEEISGYSEEEVVGHDKIWEWLYPDEKYRQEIGEKVNGILQGEEVESYETTIQCKDGGEKIISWTSHPLEDDEGELAGSIAIGRDVTEQKKTEEKLREYEAAVEESEDMIAAINDEYVYLFANKAFLDYHQMNRDEVVRRTVAEVLGEEVFRENIKPHVDRCLEGKRVQYEMKKKYPEMGERHLNIRYYPIDEETENVQKVVAHIRDITERKKAEERKDFLNTLLRQDLGSKYQTIQGYHQLIEEEADLSEKHREYFRKAIKAGRECDEILGLAKKLEEIERAELVSEKDIVKVLKQVIDDISSFVDREGVEIESDYPEKIGKVKGDYSLNIIFSQILLTRIQKSECSNIRIEAREKENNILVIIEDDGESLPENIKDMFSGEPYTGETTGVGGVRYYMVRQIAEHNNAEIEVQESDLGGTRFDIHLEKA